MLFFERALAEAVEFVLTDEALKLALMAAELLRAVGAGKALVAAGRKPLWVEVTLHLPLNHQTQSCTQEGPGVGIGNEQKGREHHGVVPVVDAAGGAAAVFHDPGLEGAEKQNADDVADGIGQGDEQQDAPVDNPGVIEDAENGVQGDPGGKHRKGHHALLVHGGGIRNGDVVFGELLLAAGAFQLIGEEPQEHIDHEEEPDDAGKHRVLLKAAEGTAGAGNGVIDVSDERRQKEAAPE